MAGLHYGTRCAYILFIFAHFRSEQKFLKFNFKSFFFRSDALLSSLNCAGSCDRIVVNSDGPAAVWQNKRTGLFKFIGEHNGRPVYQNNATKEFLFYTTVGSEWLVGPDFRKPHAGIQVSGQSPSALIWSKHSVSYFLCQNI